MLLRKCTLTILLLIAPFALAQFTNVTGTVVDPSGLPYANGTILATLILPGGASPTLNGQTYFAPLQATGLNSFGNFTVRLADNTVLLPGGTQWNFNVCSALGTVQPAAGKGPVCFSITLTISGSTQDISTNLNAVALPLTASTAGILEPTGLVQTGLIAEYRLREGTGTTIIDSSGKGNNGTFGSGGNTPTWISGSGGLSFSGGQFVTLPAAVSNPGTVLIYFSATNQTGGIAKQALLSDEPALSSVIYLDKTGSGTFYRALAGGPRIASCTSGCGSFPITVTRDVWNGTGAMAYVFDSTTDVIYINGTSTVAGNYALANGGMAGKNTGIWQLGGSVSAGYFTGSIYYVAMYNRELSASEVAANTLIITNAMIARGVNVLMRPVATDAQSQMVADGDSLTLGTGAGVVGGYSTSPPFTLNNTGQSLVDWQISNTSRGNAGFLTGTNPLISMAPFSVDPLYHPGGYRNVVIIWAGVSGSTGNEYVDLARLANYCRDRRAVGWKVIATTLTSSNSGGGGDQFKNTFNPGIRQTWATFADALVDIASDPNLGADNAFSNTTYFQADGLHHTQGSIYNDEAPLFQRAVNRLYGNQSWTSANTYTTAAPAATAITATSESTNTVTVTSTLNPPVGSTITIAGVTPSGYNGNYTVQTTSASSFTYFNFTTGLGNGTVFGTAKIPQQVDADVFVILGGSAAGNPAFTMQTCVGYTGQNLYFKNANTTSAWVLTPFGSETIDGAATLTMPAASSGNNPVVVLQSVLISSSAGGCNWKRLQ